MSNSDTSDSVAVKVLYQGVTRRFLLPTDASIDWIREKINGLFAVDTSGCVITWRDDEGDWVGLYDADDLKIAIDVSTQQGKALRLQVTAAAGDASGQAPARSDGNDWEMLNESAIGAHATAPRTSPSAPVHSSESVSGDATESSAQTSSNANARKSSGTTSGASADSGDGSAEEILFERVQEALANLRTTGVLDLKPMLDSVAEGIDIERLVEIAAPHVGVAMPVPFPHMFAHFAAAHGGGGCARACPNRSACGGPRPRCSRFHGMPHPPMDTPSDESTPHAHPQTDTPAAPGSVLPAGPLSFGSRGEGVEQLQHYLIRHHLMEPRAIRRFAGFYGPQTARAIWAFQQATGLHRDDVADVITPGTFDDPTRRALLALHAQTYDSSSSPAEAHRQPADRTEPAPAPTAATHEPEAHGHGRNAAEEGAAAAAGSPGAHGRWEKELDTLTSMGFANRELLTDMLDNAGGSVLAVVSKLIA